MNALFRYKYKLHPKRLKIMVILQNF